MSFDKNIFTKIKSSFESKIFDVPKTLWTSIDESLYNKHLEQNIKSSFEAESLTAPIFDFSKIKGVNTDLDEKISKSYEAERNILPNSVWTNVANQMDINRVWEDLSPKIITNNFSYARFAFAALIISFISLFPPTQLKNPDSTNDFIGNNTKYTSQNVTLSADQNNFNSNPKALLIAADSKNNLETTNQLRDLKGYSSSQVQVNINLPVQNVSNSVTTPENIVLEEREKISILTTPLHLIKTSLPKKQYANAIISSDPKQNKGYFRIGLIGSVNNTWINNDDMRQSFDKNSLLSSKFAFGSSAGFSADYFFNQKIGITASYFFNSSSRNKIGFYENGFYKIKKTEINYTKVSLLFNYAIPVNSKKGQKKYVLSAGPYLAYNKNSMTISDEIIVSFNSAFKKTDFGIRLKMSKEHKWSNVILGYGLNTEVGLNNITEKQNLIGSDINQTTNFNVGIFTALKYEFN